MNYVIGSLVAVGVFIYLLHALPDSSLIGTSFQRRVYDEASRRARPSTRLSPSQALAISLGLILLFVTVLSYDRQLAPLITLVIVTTSIWAAIDSDRVGLRMYKTRIALHPIVLFNAMCFLWPVLFPWYLVVCSKIGDGTIARKRTTAGGLG